LLQTSQPYVEQANAAVEHQFGTRTALSVDMLQPWRSSFGKFQWRHPASERKFRFDLNCPFRQQPLFDDSTFATATVTLPNGKTFTTPDFAAVDGFINPNFGTINAIDNSECPFYNGLLISFRHHSPVPQFGRLHALRTTDQGTGYFNQFDQASQRGPSQLDQTHRLCYRSVGSTISRVEKL